MLQVEAMAQLGGIVMMDPKDQAAKKNFFFGGIDGCKFRRPVVPGDSLVSGHPYPSLRGVIAYQCRAFFPATSVVHGHSFNNDLQDGIGGQGCIGTIACFLLLGESRIMETAVRKLRASCSTAVLMRVLCAADDARGADKIQPSLWDCKDECQGLHWQGSLLRGRADASYGQVRVASSLCKDSE